MESALFMFLMTFIAVSLSIRKPRVAKPDLGPARLPAVTAPLPEYGPGLPVPRINELVKDPEWVDCYVHQVATGGRPNSLSDQAVLQSVSDIVNNGQLSTDAKYHMLDALWMRTANDHPSGFAADVLEVISNESTALTHPDWHGRFGEFRSMKQ